MASNHEAILDQIRQLAQNLPLAAALQLATAIESASVGDWTTLRLKTQMALTNPDYREQLRDLLDHWQQQQPNLSNQAIALALEEAAYSTAHTLSDQQLELVWTGPPSEVVTPRRNDEALLEVINQANQRLTIVSFKVYRLQDVADALLRAIERGVTVRIILESYRVRQGKMTWDKLNTLGQDVARRARLFFWPKSRRLTDGEGNYGVLHAKCAVADGNTLLISSANLTGSAMELNMEMGLLVHGGVLPVQVEQHFDELIKAHILMPVRRSLRQAQKAGYNYGIREL